MGLRLLATLCLPVHRTCLRRGRDRQAQTGDLCGLGGEIFGIIAAFGEPVDRGQEAEELD
jgi:hypothetical protein